MIKPILLFFVLLGVDATVGAGSLDLGKRAQYKGSETSMGHSKTLWMVI